jgi:hypothetical protein
MAGTVNPVTLDEVQKMFDKLKKQVTVQSDKKPWEPVLLRGFMEYINLEADPPEDFEPGSNPPAPEHVKMKVVNLFKNLGLGRGIDVTCSRPFLEKKQIQIKEVEYDNLLGTDEGASLHQFAEFVQSSMELGGQYSLSLDFARIAELVGSSGVSTVLKSAPLKVSISQEASRSKTDTKVVVGARILNRTVGFKQDVEDTPFHVEGQFKRALGQLEGHGFIPNAHEECRPRLGVENGSTPEGKLSRGDKLSGGDKLSRGDKLLGGDKVSGGDKLSGEDKLSGGEKFGSGLVGLRAEDIELAWKNVSNEQKPKPEKFETELTEWVQDYITTKRKGDSKSKVVKIEDLNLENDEDRADLKEACAVYTRANGVTHYVSSIQLGAEMYKTLEHKVYHDILEMGFSVDIMEVLKTDDKKPTEIKFDKKYNLQRYATKELGKITVVDATQKTLVVQPAQEAVIGYELRPVAMLIKEKKLAKCMAQAAEYYIQDATWEIAGPFYITSHDLLTGQTVYLKKGEGDQLATTDNKYLADGFKILPADKSDEFHIIYEAEDKTEDTGSFPFYVTTRHRWSGYSREPPSIQQHPKELNTLFAFHNQLHTFFNSKQDLTEGLLKAETFLINCDGRRGKFDGYVGLERQPHYKPKTDEDSDSDSDSEKQYVTQIPTRPIFKPVCTRYCTDDDNILLAFRLLRMTSEDREKSREAKKLLAASRSARQELPA